MEIHAALGVVEIHTALGVVQIHAALGVVVAREPLYSPFPSISCNVYDTSFDISKAILCHLKLLFDRKVQMQCIKILFDVSFPCTLRVVVAVIVLCY